MKTIRQPRRGIRVEIPADRIGAVLVQRFHRVNRVALGLTHLLAVLILYMAEHDDISVRCLVEQQRGNRHQRIEPASRLVNSLGNKVSRELLLKYFFIFKWIMMLCKRHRSGVEPAVDYLRYAVHRLAALRTLHRHRIDVRAMQLDIIRTVVGFLLEFGDAADRFTMAALIALPDIERCAPVTVSADTPVLYILEPVAETAFAHALRDPVNRVVVADQVVLDSGHLDEPGLSRIVNKRCIAAPAVRIVMLKLRCGKEHAPLLEVRQNCRVSADCRRIILQLSLRRFAAHAGKRRIVCHNALVIYELQKRQVVIAADPRIVFTESRCDVDDTGTVCHRNVAVAGHEMCFLVKLFRTLAGALVKRLIFSVFQLAALEGIQHLVGRLSVLGQTAEHLIEQGGCQIIGIAVCCLNLAVFLIRVHAQCGVGRQCPRRCRPCEIPRILILRLETNDGGALLQRLIALCNLMARKRRAAARAVRNDLVAFIKKALVPDFL